MCKTEQQRKSENSMIRSPTMSPFRKRPVIDRSARGPLRVRAACVKSPELNAWKLLFYVAASTLPVLVWLWLQTYRLRQMWKGK